MMNRAQSAMEYLITYGWAILVIAVVFILLFSMGVFNPNTFAPKAKPGSCQVTRPSGQGTLAGAGEVGTCTNQIPQYVAQFNAQKTTNLTISSTGIIKGNKFTWVYWARILGPSIDISNGVLMAQGWTTMQGCSMTGGSEVLEVQANSIPSVSNSIACSSLGGTWIQYAATYNGAIATMYIDGKWAGDFAVSDNIASGATTVGGAEVVYTAYNAFAFNGMISNVQVYNTSLSANDIATLYANGIGADPINIRNLVGWWPLNGNANDYSGNGYTGISSNVVYNSNWYSYYQQP